MMKTDMLKYQLLDIHTPVLFELESLITEEKHIKNIVYCNYFVEIVVNQRQTQNCDQEFPIGLDPENQFTVSGQT